MERDQYILGKWTSRWTQNPRGTYIKKTINGQLSAVLCCNGCGKCVSISNHRISNDGEVNPSVVCTVEGCNYHKWVQLVNW